MGGRLKFGGESINVAVSSGCLVCGPAPLKPCYQMSEIATYRLYLGYMNRRDGDSILIYDKRSQLRLTATLSASLGRTRKTFKLVFRSVR
jgi:hypothetical protein